MTVAVAVLVAILLVIGLGSAFTRAGKDGLQ